MGPDNWGEDKPARRQEVVFLTYKEAHEGHLRAFNKCQLRYDKFGRKYRTEIPRGIPDKEFDFRRKKEREEG